MEPVAESLPFCKQAMTGKYLIELVSIKNSGFNELEDTGEIFGATEL